MLMTQSEIAELTDAKRPAEQIVWLRERGWHFEIGRSGCPKVDSREYDRHMIGTYQRREKALNLGALNGKT